MYFNRKYPIDNFYPYTSALKYLYVKYRVIILFFHRGRGTVITGQSSGSKHVSSSSL